MALSEAMAITETELLTVLRERFGYQSFRGKQAEVMLSAISGRDTICIAPTSSGKSLNFQLPALMLPGVTVVVSPLIALMKDQVDGLTAKGIPATFINSSLGQNEYDERMDKLGRGAYKLLYVSPERFGNQRFVEAMRAVKVSLFAVDEAHCLTAETIVSTPSGGRRIDAIAIGESVYSSENGVMTTRRVVSKFIHRGSDIWKVRVNGRDIYCDSGQKFFVKDIGFVRADELRCNQEVLSFEEVQQIHVYKPQAAGASDNYLPDVRHNQNSREAKKQATGKILLSPMLAQGIQESGQDSCTIDKGLPDLPKDVPDKTRLQNCSLFGEVRPKIETKMPGSIRADEGAQPHVYTRCGGNGFTKVKRDRQAKKISRRQWAWPFKSRGDVGKSRRIQAQPYHSNWPQNQGWEWLSFALQAGLGVAFSESCCGSGWSFSRRQEPPTARQAQGAVSAFARVESVSRVQRGSILGCGERLGENPAGVPLYDIEVEGSHNFFANGVLAHNCISHWGHDFRPDYARLGKAVELLGRPPVIALTATATPDVRDDVIKQLGLRNYNLFASGFERSNLSLEVKPVSGTETKLFHVCQEIGKWKTGIVYCATRKNVELVTARLQQMNVRCLSYHGGMKDEDRTMLQQRFMEGQTPVAVATNAFGMGIDRSDLRFVTHYDIPGSVEALYQECVHADSLVCTGDVNVPADSLGVGDAIESCNVQTGKFSSARITRRFDGLSREGVEVRTAFGRTLRLTQSHPVFAGRSGAPPAFKKAGDLCCGDRLLDKRLRLKDGTGIHFLSVQPESKTYIKVTPEFFDACRSRLTVKQIGDALLLNRAHDYTMYRTEKFGLLASWKAVARLAGFTLDDLYAAAVQVKGTPPSKAMNIPSTNEDLGWLTGMVATDGHIKPTTGFGGTCRSFAVRFGNTNANIIAKFINILDAYGIHHSTRQREPQTGGLSKKTFYEVSFSSLPLIRFLNWAGIPVGHKSFTCDCPSTILTAGTKFRRGFIAGVIDGNGSISHRGIRLYSASWKFISGFVKLLQVDDIWMKLDVQPHAGRFGRIEGHGYTGRVNKLIWCRAMANTIGCYASKGYPQYKSANPNHLKAGWDWQAGDFIVEILPLNGFRTVNFTVEPNNTYLVDGIVTHNCGRAGRDGAASNCLLLYGLDSVETQKFFIDGSNPTRDAIQYTYDALQHLCRFGPVNVPIDKIAEQVREVRNPMAVGTILKLLERHQLIRRWRGEGSGRAYHTDLKRPIRTLDEAGIDFGALNSKRVRDMARLDEVVRYADQFHKCRQGYILSYFGEDYKNCGRCDVCRARRS